MQKYKTNSNKPVCWQCVFIKDSENNKTTEAKKKHLFGRDSLDQDVEQLEPFMLFDD